MTRVLIAVALTLAGVTGVSAAVSGIVTNRTSGKPQGGVKLTLVKLGQGMQNLGSAETDASGNFTLEVTVEPGSPHLLQANFQDVTYNKMLPPGSSTGGVQVDVYSASPDRGNARVIQHAVMMKPENGLSVSELVFFENAGNTTFADAKNGTLKLFVPEGASELRVSVTGPQGMPVNRPAEKTGDANVYKVNYPIKPGETQFEISYRMPSASEFAGKILHDAPLRLITPAGVEAQGEGITKRPPDSRIQANIYEVAQGSYAVKLTGTAAAAPRPGPEQDEVPQIEEKKPRIYDRLVVVLPLIFTILALGFALLYRRSDPLRQAK
jgi:hypothetical protein